MVFLPAVLSKSNDDTVVVLGGSMSIVFGPAIGGRWTLECPSLADLFDDYAGAQAYLKATAAENPDLAKAAGIAAAYVLAAESHGLGEGRVRIGLRSGACYFTDRSATPTLGAGDWAKIVGGPSETAGCKVDELRAFLEAALLARGPALSGPLTISVTAGSSHQIREARTELLMIAASSIYPNHDNPFYFTAVAPAQEAWFILDTVVRANTNATRGLGYYYSTDDTPRLTLPGKIIYGFSGRAHPAPSAPSVPSAPARHRPPHTRLPPAQGRQSTPGCSALRTVGRQCLRRARRPRTPTCPTLPCRPPDPPRWMLRPLRWQSRQRFRTRHATRFKGVLHCC